MAVQLLVLLDLVVLELGPLADQREKALLLGKGLADGLSEVHGFDFLHDFWGQDLGAALELEFEFFIDFGRFEEVVV